MPAAPRKAAAKKVASPQRQARRNATAPADGVEVRGETVIVKRGGRKAAAPVIEPDEVLPAAVPTRTSTRGAAARTATPARGRTAAVQTVAVGPALAAPPSAVPDDDPTDTPEGEPGDEDTVWEIPFQGRTFKVRRPNLEQLTVYKRLSKRFQELAEKHDAKPMTIDEATGHYDRAIKLITSVLVDRDDIDFLEDEMLERRLLLEDAGELLRLAFERMGSDQINNRADRRKSRARLAD